VIKNFIKSFFLFFFRIKFFNQIFSIIKDLNYFEIIKTEKYIFYLLITNWITHYRAKTFFTKEPDTLVWIKKMDPYKVFWDIGANVGIYSIYAAKVHKNFKVYSFEPSVLNLNILVKNINKNKLNKKITIITSPLSDKLTLGNFNLGSSEEASANSSFNAKRSRNLSYMTNSLNSKLLKKFYKIQQPDYVKIDVDGNEFEILKDLLSVFNSIESILIEVNKNEREIKGLMRRKGYFLESKGTNTDNTVWRKKLS
jgi:FkbM family methyltransferase